MLYAAYLVLVQGDTIHAAADNLGVKWETVASWVELIGSHPDVLAVGADYYRSEEALADYMISPTSGLRLLPELGEGVAWGAFALQVVQDPLAAALAVQKVWRESEQMPVVDALADFMPGLNYLFLQHVAADAKLTEMHLDQIDPFQESAV